jgi:hypothetical protein
MKKIAVWIMSLVFAMTVSFAFAAEDPPASAPVQKEVKNTKAKKKKKKSKKKGKKNKKSQKKNKKSSEKKEP